MSKRNASCTHNSSKPDFCLFESSSALLLANRTQPDVSPGGLKNASIRLKNGPGSIQTYYLSKLAICSLALHFTLIQCHNLYPLWWLCVGDCCTQSVSRRNSVCCDVDNKQHTDRMGCGGGCHNIANRPKNRRTPCHQNMPRRSSRRLFHLTFSL